MTDDNRPPISDATLAIDSASRESRYGKSFRITEAAVSNLKRKADWIVIAAQAPEERDRTTAGRPSQQCLVDGQGWSLLLGLLRPPRQSSLCMDPARDMPC